MHYILEQYKILVQFLGEVLGSDYEVVLHDVREGHDAVIAIANGQISERTVGAPLTSLGMRFLADREYEHADYKVGYRGMSKKKSQLRSSTMFIKDEDGQVIGMLCINFDPSHCLQAANALLTSRGLSPIGPDCVLGGECNPGAHSDVTEHFVQSFSDMVFNAIEEVTGQADFPANRLTMDEKVQIVTALYQAGVFSMKGAVSEVAQQLATSEATIYRYLGRLKK